MSWRVHAPRNELTWLACRAISIRTLGDGPPNSLIGNRPWVDDVAIGSSLIDEGVIAGEIALASSRFTVAARHGLSLRMCTPLMGAEQSRTR